MEASFRCLKSDLDLRPIYYKKAITTTALEADGQWGSKRTCSVPEPKLVAIYEALNYLQKQKFVVLKIPPHNIRQVQNQVLTG